MSLGGHERAIVFARRLRRAQTNVEGIPWKEVRNRKLLGRKFLRQHPIFTDPTDHGVFYIADFYCHEARLVIELDGGIHETRREYDRRRTEVLELMRLRVVRFTNDDVEENLQEVLEKIRQALTLPPFPPSLREEKRGDFKGG